MLSLSIKESLRLFRMCQQVKALSSCSNYFLIKWNCLRIWQVPWVRKHILNSLREFFSLSIEPILYYIKSGPPFSSLSYRDSFNVCSQCEGRRTFHFKHKSHSVQNWEGKKKDSVWGKRDKKEGKRIEKSRNTERTRTEIKWGKFLLLLILFSVLVSTFFLFHSPVALFDLLGNHFSCSVVSLTFFFPINYYPFYINALNPLYMIF